MRGSHRFTLKLLSLLTSSKPLFSSGVTKEAAFPGRQLWEVWDSRKVMTLAKVLTQLLVKAGNWALCSHSSSFEALALISELATAARSHPACDAGVYRRILRSFFPTLTLQAHFPEATASQGPCASSASLAAAGLGNAQWAWHGKSNPHLPSNTAADPRKSSETCPSWGGKTSNFGLQVIKANISPP